MYSLIPTPLARPFSLPTLLKDGGEWADARVGVSSFNFEALSRHISFLVCLSIFLRQTIKVVDRISTILLMGSS